VTPRRARAATSGSIATLLFTVTACSGSVDDASAAYCASLQDLRGEVRELLSLVSSDADVDDVRDQREAVSEVFDELRAESESLQEALRESGEAAHEDFQDAVADIPGDVAVSEAIAAYREAARDYAAALVALRDDAGCDAAPVDS
jgi:hypothetical protein